MIKKFNVFGMSCASCKSNIEKVVAKVNGVISVQVNLISNSMEVECLDNVKDKTIINALKSIGYDASIDGTNDNEKANLDEIKVNDKKAELHAQRNKLILSSVLLLVLLYIAMGPMIGLPEIPFFKGTNNILIFALAQFLLTTIIVLLNNHFFKRGFKALFKLVPNMDSLVALGASAAYAYGIIVLFILAYALGHDNNELLHSYMHSLYFESAATILTLVSLGKYFENKAKIKTSDELSKLMKLTPKKAQVIRNGSEVEIPTSNVVVDDILIIRPGDSIPVDGVIVEGKGVVDQSAITGESLPVSKSVGDQVISSCINNNGTFKFRATKVGKDTVIAQIVKLVEHAGNSKAPIAKLADCVSGIFVPLVLAISLLTFIIWIIFSDMSQAFNFAISVLVISCPCALGLATPLAVMVATGKAAQYGILLKDAESLEKLGKIDTVVLDKTGTITEGKLEVVEIITFTNDLEESDMLNYIYTLEKNSTHPIAKAIVEHIKDNVNEYEISDFKEDVGKGTSGVIEGNNVWIGNLNYLNDKSSLLNGKNEIYQKIVNIQNEGKTFACFGIDSELVSIIVLSDTVRKDSKAAIKKIKNMGIKVVMLTGDNKESASAIKSIVEVDDVISEVLPNEKYKYIENLKKDGKIIAMVGDGINDSPSLKLADIGVAIGSGTDIALESADIVLMRNSLDDLKTAIALSKKTIANIKMSLFWAFFYNAISIPLAAGLLYPLWKVSLNPMIASLAMSLSSICVVINALTLKLFKNKVKEGGHVKKHAKIMEKEIIIEGMSCMHCKARVETIIKNIDGVVNVEVDLSSKKAKVRMNKEIKDEVFKNEIEKAGYKVLDIK